MVSNALRAKCLLLAVSVTACIQGVDVGSQRDDGGQSAADSGSSSDAGLTNDAGADGDGGFDAGFDAGSTHDGGLDGGGDAGLSTDGGDGGLYQGTVWLESVLDDATSGGQDTWYVGARFVLRADSICRTYLQQNCKVTDCGDVSDGDDFASAGTLSITGTTPPLTLMPEPGPSSFENAYNFSTMSQLWSDGASLTVTASGDPNGVPAFSQSITAPLGVQVTQFDGKPWPVDGGLTLSIADPHTFEWAFDGGDGEVWVAAQGWRNVFSVITVECPFPAADRSGVFPAKIFPNGVRTPPLGRGSWVGVSRFAKKQLTVGNYGVTVRVGGPATTATGATAKAVVDFQ